MKRVAYAILLFSLLACLMMVSLGIRPAKANIITVPDDYLTIQEAINHAGEGDTILVLNGTYCENVLVNRTVTLVGENRESTIIDGPGSGDVVFVGADNVVIRDFTVRNSSLWDVGIYVWNHVNITIENNIIVDNYYGIWLRNALDCTMRDNRIADNRFNLDVTGSTVSHYIHTIDTSNTVNDKPVYYWVSWQNDSIPHDAGYVGLVNCVNITVSDLLIEFNEPGILLINATSSTVCRNVLTRNGFGIVATVGCHHNTIAENNVTANAFDGMILSKSDFNTIHRNNFHDNHQSGITFNGQSNVFAENTVTENSNVGIWIEGSSNNTFSSNDISENLDGVFLFDSSDNLFVANKIMGSVFLGVSFCNSSSNVLLQNCFANNPPDQIYSVNSSVNIFDNGTAGNFWSDYTGGDSDGDGIGDTPYVIDENNRDHFPLMKVGWNPGWNPGDIDYDLDVDIFDLVRCAAAYGTAPTDDNWDPPCDIAAPYGIINIFDIVTVAVSYGDEFTL